MKLIDKDALVAEIERRFDEYSSSILKHYDACKEARAQELGKILTIIGTLEVKEMSVDLGDPKGDKSAKYIIDTKTLEVKIDENHLEKFKSLQHISRDLHQTLEDWGYAPNLYFFDGKWHVSWISCEEGDSIKGFEGNTPEEAIDKAYNWFHSTFKNA